MVAIRAVAREVPVLKPADVRFGSKADIEAPSPDVRFTPKSGHRETTLGCPLCARSGHDTEMVDNLFSVSQIRRWPGRCIHK